MVSKGDVAVSLILKQGCSLVDVWWLRRNVTTHLVRLFSRHHTLRQEVIFLHLVLTACLVVNPKSRSPVEEQVARNRYSGVVRLAL